VLLLAPLSSPYWSAASFDDVGWSHRAYASSDVCDVPRSVEDASFNEGEDAKALATAA